MKLISCLIIDDEPLAIDLLRSYVEKTPFLELRATALSTQEAMIFLAQESVDLLFLDIQMPGLSGVEFASTLRNGPRIIFSTAFPQYAIEGFRLDAIDYLLKPYDYTEFLRAAHKAQEVILKSSPTLQTAARPPFFFVKSEYKLVRIDLDRILYIEGMKDYAKIYLLDEPKPVITLMSLKSLLEKLSPQDFMRVHRSYIIHLRFVNSVERGGAMIGKMLIPIAEKYKALVDSQLTAQA